MQMASEPQPFRLHVPDAAIADLRQRLARTRFPDQAPGEPWAYGTPVAYMRELVDFWRQDFDWRGHEAQLNGFPQYKVALGGIDLHYLHVPGRGPDPMPLLLMHGWPGSVFEFLEAIPYLTDPARFGGDAADAVTVVVPSLPGYGLSFAPGQRRFSVGEMGDLFVTLMRDVLGYQRFGIQGGDWGAFIAQHLGYTHPDPLIGIHLNMMPMRRDIAWTKRGMTGDPTPDEERYLAQLHNWVTEEYGYSYIQGTRPQTLAFAMTDSPAGLAAWIVEKFQRWSGGGDIEALFTKDQLLANISFYWFTEAIGSSFWPYYARLHEPWPVPDGALITVPTGYAEFPSENVMPPPSVAGRVFADIRRWSRMERGGHFAAFQEPRALSADILAFFRDLRGETSAAG
jgi:pimeloyl-ACP methyl ester carboxylesterase